MPTGYTAGVQDGSITTLRQYVEGCMRAFGACVTMRDDPADAPIKEFEPLPYYKTSLEEAQQELERLKGLTKEECDLEARDEYEKDITRFQEGIKEKSLQKYRYEDMLYQVKMFNSPSKEHEKFTEFLLSQLTESIQWDCGGTFWEDRLRELILLSGEAWRNARLKEAEENVRRRQNDWDNEVQRTKERSEWIAAVRKELDRIEGLI